MINEATLRDLLYSFIVNYLQSQGIRGVVIPEFVVQGNMRADLAVYTCNGDNCYPFMVIETKLSTNERTTFSKAERQAQDYASKLNALYTVVIGLIKGRWTLRIMRGQSTVIEKWYDDLNELLHDFMDFFTNNITTPSSSFGTTGFNSLINAIQRAPTYESFLRAEFSRIINIMGLRGVNGNHYYPVSECPVISGQRLSGTRADLVVFRDWSTAVCDYPLLVLEFKSYLDRTAIFQAKGYADDLMAHYYGAILGHGKQAKVEVYERKSNRKILTTTIGLGNPYLDGNEVERILTALPPVQGPVHMPLNGVVELPKLRELGAKVVNLPLARHVRFSIWGFKLPLDEGGVKYPGYDYRVIIDCPAKLTRLVFFDPNNSLQWCEFRNGELVRCNTNVDVVLSSSPCCNTFDKIFP